jgi:hypothetical protein
VYTLQKLGAMPQQEQKPLSPYNEDAEEIEYIVNEMKTAEPLFQTARFSVQVVFMSVKVKDQAKSPEALPPSETQYLLQQSLSGGIPRGFFFEWYLMF